MIISSSGRFVFMHNPKVAGSSVRTILDCYRDADTDLFDTDPDPFSPTHRTDRAHIGIDEFAHLYPDLWARTKGLPFFALYRAPKDRFLSSVNEYSRVYGDTDIRFAPKEQRADFLSRTWDRLAQKGKAENIMSSLEFTHFRPQWIYMSRENGPTPSVHAYELREFADFTADLSKVCGEPISFPRENSSEQFVVGGAAGKLLGNNAIKKALRRIPGSMLAMQMLRKTSRSDTSKAALSPTERYGLNAARADELNEFVEMFYSRDIAFIADFKQEIRPSLAST